MSRGRDFLQRERQTFPADSQPVTVLGSWIVNAVPPWLALPVLSAALGRPPPGEELLAKLDWWQRLPAQAVRC